MNHCGYRAVRSGLSYRAQYRISKWAKYRDVRDEYGEIAVFPMKHEAELAGAEAMTTAINGLDCFWRSGRDTEARQAAERYFHTRAENGETQTQAEGKADARQHAD